MLDWRTCLLYLAVAGGAGYLAGSKWGARIGVVVGFGALGALETARTVMERRNQAGWRAARQMPTERKQGIFALDTRQTPRSLDYVLAQFRALPTSERARWFAGQEGSTQEQRAAVLWYCPNAVSLTATCATLRPQVGLPSEARS